MGADLLAALLIAAAGKLSTFSTHDDPNPPDRNSQYYYYAAAGVFGASSIYGLVAGFVCDGRVTAIEDAESREVAHSLHMRAADAANAGDCSVAHEVDAQIRERDPKYYLEVFRADPVIQRCLPL